MKVHDLFSKRQKHNRGEVSDVYQYNIIPEELRVQLVHIIRDAFGDLFSHREGALNAYKYIHEALCREYGVFSLGSRDNSDNEASVNFLLKTQETDKTIDMIELTFQMIDYHVQNNLYDYSNRKLSPDDAIAELNYRFREQEWAISINQALS